MYHVIEGRNGDPKTPPAKAAQYILNMFQLQEQGLSAAKDMNPLEVMMNTLALRHTLTILIIMLGVICHCVTRLAFLMDCSDELHLDCQAFIIRQNLISVLGSQTKSI